jgi:hypothetical protein
MKNQTRKTASNTAGAIGAIAAMFGSISAPSPYVIIDMALGGAIWFGIVYGICSLIIKVRKTK